MKKEELIVKFKQYPVAYVCSALSVVLAIIFYVRSGANPEIEDKRFELEQDLKRIVTNEIRSTDLPAHLEDIQSIVEEIDDRLMRSDDKAINYKFFYKIEEETGVNLKNISQSEQVQVSKKKKAKKKSNSKFQPIKFTVSITGKYKQILKFLYLIQNGKYFTRMIAFDCKSVGGDEVGLISVKIEIDILGLS